MSASNFAGETDVKITINESKDEEELPPYESPSPKVVKQDDWSENETKEDPHDALSNMEPITFTDDAAPPPTFARRMSSQLSVHLERQTSALESSGMGALSSFASHIQLPGLGNKNNAGASTLKKTYFCNICFSYYPISEGFTLRNCNHQFCIECIQNFFVNKINDGSIYLKCFHPSNSEQDKPCGCEIAEEDIHQLVNSETWQKYERFKSNLENTLSRQCPYCNHTQIGNASQPKMKCEKCEKEYCLFHSNAHPMDETCESYELRTAKETKMNEMALKELGDGVKPCPKCQFRIIKNGGCSYVHSLKNVCFFLHFFLCFIMYLDHMKCVKCGCSFCWLCMEEIEDTELPNHYKDEKSGCKGKQFEGMDGGDPPPTSVLIMIMLFMCVFCIPGIALGCVFGCVCHPIAALCYSEEKSVFETIGMCSFIWMLLPAVIILSLVIIIWSGLKSMYDNLQYYVCRCLPNCPHTWIDQIHDQQAQPHAA